MKQSIDLHLHSYYSEGKLSIAELLEHGKAYGHCAMVLTDHNTIAGSAEFMTAARKQGLATCSGVELYTNYQGKPLHLLGYNFDLNNSALLQTIAKLQTDNKKQTAAAIKNLAAAGFEIEEQRIWSGPSHNYGVVHLLEEIETHSTNTELLHKALPPGQRAFFDKISAFFSRGKPGFIPLSELPTVEAIALIQKAGGMTSLAHPGQQLTFEQDGIINALADAGLDALEIVSPYHNWHQIEHYQKYALEHNLLITGGSDYHCDISFSDEELIHRQWDYLRVPKTLLKHLSDIIK